MPLTKRLLPPDYLTIYFIMALVLSFIFPGLRIIDYPYNYLGIFLMLPGGILNIWADQVFKHVQTTVKPFQKPAQLVDRPPYNFSRHPMYVGFIAILLGWAIILGNILAFFAPLLMYITLSRLFIPFEEQQLNSVFGTRYQNYQHRVHKWL